MTVFTGYGTFAWNISGTSSPTTKTIEQVADWSKATISSSYGRLVAQVTGYDGTRYMEEVTYDTFTANIVFTANGQTIGTAYGYSGSWNDLNRLRGVAFYERLLSGDDTIHGADGNDILYGFGGTDKIYGNAGNDLLVGGVGTDYIYGGPGDDFAAYTYDLTDYLFSRRPSNGSIAVIFKDGSSEYIHWDVENAIFRDATIQTSTLQYYGVSSWEKQGSQQSVYRFFNTKDKAFFYTTSPFERDMILDKSSVSRNNIDEWPYVFQGTTFEAAHSYAGSVPVDRFFNTETGHHFYTTSRAESDFIKQKIATKQWAFVFEGQPFSVYPTDPNPTGQGHEVAVQRFYSPSLNRHWFTSSQEEINQIRLAGIWIDEGIAFWGEASGA